MATKWPLILYFEIIYFVSWTVSSTFKWFLWSCSPDETVRTFVCGGSGGCDPSCCGDVPGAAGRAQCQLGELRSSSKTLKRPTHSSIQDTANCTFPNFFSANTIHFVWIYVTTLLHINTACLPELCQKWDIFMALWIWSKLQLSYAVSNVLKYWNNKQVKAIYTIYVFNLSHFLYYIVW